MENSSKAAAAESADDGEIVALLQSMFEKGVCLWVEQGTIKYSAPRGALAHADVSRLKGRKAELLSRLDSLASPQGGMGCGLRTCFAPLAYSQLAHLQLYRLLERESSRYVAVAISLRGGLDEDALRGALSKVVLRHGALRTGIAVVDGVPMQRIVDSPAIDPSVQPLVKVELDRADDIQHLLNASMFDPIEITADPLFNAELFQITTDEHVLVLSMEHIISDGASLTVVLSDLARCYRTIVCREEVSVVLPPAQFSDYAARQRGMQPAWREAHGEYWSRRLDGCGRVRFPRSRRLGTVSRDGLGLVRFRIDAELRVRLVEWSRSKRTTLPMSVLAAYSALVLRWCGAADVVIRYQTDGRFGPELLEAVGYFAFPLHLRLRLEEVDTFADVLRKLVVEYCNAQGHADFSFLEAQVPRPEYTYNTCFNWLPSSFSNDTVEPGWDETGLSVSEVQFTGSTIPDFRLDTEPLVAFIDEGTCVQGILKFPTDQFDVDAMTCFARNLIAFIEVLLGQPRVMVRNVPLSL